MHLGWQPVFRRRGMIKATRDSKGGKLFTVFVDNIPDSMNPKSLFQLFAKFGIVKDVFIPKKRRKITGSRFGFVRYDCSVAAEMAVQRADGLWCDDKALRVKGAEFKRVDPGKIKQSEGTNQRAQNMVRNSHWADHRGVGKGVRGLQERSLHKQDQVCESSENQAELHGPTSTESPPSWWIMCNQKRRQNIQLRSSFDLIKLKMKRTCREQKQTCSIRQQIFKL
ncbi:unnamed protein product [Camellia sinensis]